MLQAKKDHCAALRFQLCCGKPYTLLFKKKENKKHNNNKKPHHDYWLLLRLTVKSFPPSCMLILIYHSV